MAKPLTKLDRLNELLKEHADELGLPAFRSTVGASGSNLDWLARKIGVRTDIDPEIVYLLNTKFKNLLEPVD